MDTVITLDEETLVMCSEFAKARMAHSKSLYLKRNSSNEAKILEDIMTGSMGECAIYQFMRSNGYEISEPDFNIYTVKKKSFAADMRIGQYMIHCKTQSADSAKKYGLSSILQYGRGTDRLFTHKSPQDYLIMAVVRSRNTVEILCILPVSYLFEHDLIGEPRIKWLQGIKKAIYFNTIPKEMLWTFPLRNGNIAPDESVPASINKEGCPCGTNPTHLSYKGDIK